MSDGRSAEAFECGDPETRRLALVTLAPTAGPGARDLVMQGLGDPDWRVRKEATRVATELARSLGLVPALVAAIAQGENVGLRNAALEVVEALGADAEEAVVDALAVAAGTARKFLVEALGGARGDRAVATLAAAAEDEDPNVAAAAIDALARVGGTLAVRALRGRLRAADPYQRMAALDALDRLEVDVPWEELEPLVADRLVRRVAIPALGRSGHPAAASVLAEALQERSPHVVHAAIVALARLAAASEETERAVAAALERASARVHAVLAEALAREAPRLLRVAATQLALIVRLPAALPVVVDLVADDALPPRALDALARWGEAATVPLLERAAEVDGVRRAVALELAADLATTGDEALRGALRSALADPAVAVVAAAARSLARHGGEEDVEALVAAAESDSELVAHACADALAAIARRFPRAVEDAVSRRPLTGHAGSVLATVVVALGGPDALERVREALASDEPATRRAAVASLGGAPSFTAAELAAFALADEDVDVQTAAAQALGRMRVPEVAEVAAAALCSAIEVGAPEVRAAAARALGQLGYAPAIPRLRACVRAGEPGVAAAALEALRGLGDPEIDDLLVDALASDDGGLVQQALITLACRPDPRTVSRLAAALAHAHWDVRRLAATLLGELGGEEARVALAAHLRLETNDLVRAVVQEAIGRTLRGGGST
jgi:HEAT repeat protein